MTEPVRPLEALIAEKIAEWRKRAAETRVAMKQFMYGGERDGEILDDDISANFEVAMAQDEAADELAALLQAAAPPDLMVPQGTWSAVMDYLNEQVPETRVCSGIRSAVKVAVETLKSKAAAPPAPTAEPSPPNEAQKRVLVLIAETRRCINDGEFAAAFRKLDWIERYTLAAPPAPTAERCTCPQFGCPVHCYTTANIPGVAAPPERVSEGQESWRERLRTARLDGMETDFAEEMAHLLDARPAVEPREEPT